MNALDLKGIKKEYKNGFKALKGINLQVKEGDFFGLLGPNGAGKTTTIGIITGLVNKTAGTVKAFGHDMDKDPEAVKRTLGVVPQEVNVIHFDRPWDIVTEQAGFYGLPKTLAKKRAEKYLKQLSLWEKRNNLCASLSGGMKRRLMIARALVHHPKILILDEPTAGVDLEIRRQTWDFLKELNKNGTTIILTTHYLEEAETLCKNIAIIDQGKILDTLPVKDIAAKLEEQTFILDTDKKITKEEKWNNYFIKPGEEDTIEVTIPKKGSVSEIIQHLAEKKIIVNSMKTKQTRLEQLFVEKLKKQ